MRQQHLEEFLSEAELIDTKAQLLQFEDCVHQISVVIKIRIQMRASVLVGRE